MVKMEKVLAEVAHCWRYIDDDGRVKFSFEFMTAAGNYYECDRNARWYDKEILVSHGGSYDVENCMLGDTVYLYLMVESNGHRSIRGWKKVDSQNIGTNEVLEAVILPPPSLPAAN